MGSAKVGRSLTPRTMVQLWMVGFLGSLLIQTVFQSWFAAHSAWGANVGWQNEIAIRNLGVLVVLGGVLRANAGVERLILPGLAILSFCFAANHFAALARAPQSLSNIAGATMNTLAVAMYAWFRATGSRSAA